MARSLPASPSPADMAMSRLGHARPAPARAVPEVVARRRIGPNGAVPFLLSQNVESVDEDHPSPPFLPPLPPASASIPALPRVDPALTGMALARARARAWLQAVPPAGRWLRHCVLGATLAFADASVATLAPVAFLWRNAGVVGTGAIYLLLPLASSLAVLYHVPSLGQAYDPLSLGGLIFLVGLYASCAFGWLLGAFATAAGCRAGARLARHFAKQGRQAFS